MSITACRLYSDPELRTKLYRKSHHDTFRTWLSFDLEQQKADLELYLTGLIEQKAAAIDTWLRLHPYRNVVPLTASGVDKELFLIDFGAVLELLRVEYGVASRIQTHSDSNNLADNVDFCRESRKPPASFRRWMRLDNQDILIQSRPSDGIAISALKEIDRALELIRPPRFEFSALFRRSGHERTRTDQAGAYASRRFRYRRSDDPSNPDTVQEQLSGNLPQRWIMRLR